MALESEKKLAETPDKEKGDAEEKHDKPLDDADVEILRAYVSL